jgi:hypothetical protein
MTQTRGEYNLDRQNVLKPDYFDSHALGIMLFLWNGYYENLKKDNYNAGCNYREAKARQIH